MVKIIIVFIFISTISFSKLKANNFGNNNNQLTSLKVDDIIDVRDFGAVGNGVVDDVNAIQKALNEGHIFNKKVVGHKDDIYYVSSQGLKKFMTSSVTNLAYCLEIPSGVTFDLRGATIRSNSDAVLISNKNSFENTDNSIKIVNGIFDGSCCLLLEKPFIFFYGVNNLILENITVINTTHLVSTFTNITNSYFNNLIAKNIKGNCWQFGLPTKGQEVKNSTFGNIYAYDIFPENEPIYPGSPFIGNLVNCKISLLQAENVGSGLKIQHGSKDLIISKIILKGTNNKNYNSGFKIQGLKNYLVENIIVDTIISSNQKGSGLYIDMVKNVKINYYLGKNNAYDGIYPDIWLSGCNINIYTLISKSTGGCGVMFRPGIQNYYCNNIIIDSFGNKISSSAIIIFGPSKGKIDSVNIFSNKTNYIGLNIVDNNCVGTCKHTKFRGLSDLSLISINKAAFFIDNLMLSTSQRNSMIIPVKNHKIFNTSLGYFEIYNGYFWEKLE